MTHGRDAFLLTEAVVAAFLLALVAIPVLSLASGAQRASAGCLRRALLETRAREHLAEAAATEHGGLLALDGAALPVTPTDAPTPEGAVTGMVTDLAEDTRAADVVPGLARAICRISWVEPEDGHRRRLRASCLYVRPTLTLEDRVPRANEVQP